MAKICNSCIPEANKISKRQSILSTPAKLNATISKTLSERLRLTIQNFRIGKEDLKEKVMDLQQESQNDPLKFQKI